MPYDMTEWADAGRQAGMIMEAWADAATLLALATFLILTLTFAIGSDGPRVSRVRNVLLSLGIVCMAGIAVILAAAPVGPAQSRSFDDMMNDAYGITSFQFNGSTAKTTQCFMTHPCVDAESLPAPGDYQAIWITDAGEQADGHLNVNGNIVTLTGPDGIALTPKTARQ